MRRVTGHYRAQVAEGETVRAFVPHPLPPRRPVLRVEGPLLALHDRACAAIGHLGVAGAMVPSPNWLLYRAYLNELAD